MLDEDMQIRYYNGVIRREEQQCRYYSTIYLTFSSFSSLSRHLQEAYKLLQESKRDAKAKNVQISLKQGFAQAIANPQKRQRLNTKTVNQDRLESL